MKMLNNPAEYEVVIKQYLRSILILDVGQLLWELYTSNPSCVTNP